ncbi:MAG: low molecular weight phosphatase family protein [Rhodospirillaceae bacterium]|nr:low molecular weight phosphatase family protein [Rhodospirillaceae bacterium]|tara:strand:+ start:826 stop:1260 length:435 start_codon:yes stop_codon:yes gene_type:complete
MINKFNSILFVCGLNGLRSPMAEGLVKSNFKKKVYVDSVGAEVGILDPMAVEVMAEINIDISEHRPKSLSGLLDTSFDIIVILSDRAENLVYEMMKLESIEILNWPVGDPSDVEGNREQRLNAYREVRDCLRNKIEELFSTNSV